MKRKPKSQRNIKNERDHKKEKRKEESDMDKATEITGPKIDFQAEINTL